MKRRIISILMTLCMIFGLFTVNMTYDSGEAQAANAITKSDFLKANGKYLYTNYGNGDAVVLRGTNAGGYLLQEFWMCPTDYSGNVSDQMDIINTLTSRFGADAAATLIDVYEDNYWTETDFDNCAALGMNCIRLPLWYRNLVDANGNLLSNAFEKIDWFIEEAGERGIYVIVDMHGAPGSQNGSDHSGIDGGDSKQAASEFFFGDNAAANQELYYELWEIIAKRYVGNPTVAGYDLLNEPYCTYRYNSGYSDDYLHSLLWNIYDKAYDVIRAVDPDHVIIMEATWNPVDLPNPDTYGWTNVMYEYHNYLYDDYDNTNGGQISNMQTKLDAITSANYNVPSYMGEFCYMNSASAWQQGLQLLNDYGINWTTWTYKVTSNYGNWGLYNQNVESVNVETDSYDEIYRKWSNVGSSYVNSTLVDAIKSYFSSELDLPAQGTVYEAENYTITGGGVSEAQSFYSGGYAAGNMNSGVAYADVASDWSNIKSVQFTNVTANYTGTHTLRIAYNGDDDKTILVKVNGGENIQVSLPKQGDGSWNVMHSAEIEIELNEGSNTIWVSGTINDINTWANIDYIEVIGDEYDYATSENGTIYEAEKYSIMNGGIRENQSFYSGGYAAGNMNSSVAYADVASDWSNIKYVNFNDVYAEKAGTYNITIAYNGDNTKTMLMKVNGGSNIQVSIPQQGDGTWDVMYKHTVQVNLNQGNNIIWVSGTINDITTWANIDYIEVVYAEDDVPVAATVTYMNNGSQYDSKAVSLGSTISSSMPAAPARDGYVFLGWFSENVGTVSSVNSSLVSKAVNLGSAVNSDTTLYAGWLDIGTVSRDSNDTVSPSTSNTSGLYLLGAQYRAADSEHSAGVRFVARISDNLVSGIEALDSANASLQPDSTSDKGVGYGFVLSLAKKLSATNMLVKDVNATNPATGMAVCPAVNTYEDYDGYNLYTAVVVGIPSESYATDIAARMYITYYDANGTLQTYYYTENDSASAVGGAYYTNFNAVYAASN